MRILKSRPTVILVAADLGVVLVLAWQFWRANATESAKITGYEVSSDDRTVTLQVMLGGGAKILSAGVVTTDADSRAGFRRLTPPKWSNRRNRAAY